MPELSREQFSQLKKMLDDRYEALRVELNDEMRTRDENIGATTEEVPDSADSSFAHLTMDLDNAAVTRDVAERRAIEGAHARMNEGTYGICVDCGVDIPFERLQVQPAAERCAPCQERYEKSHEAGGGRGPTL
ncbi:TraR/DksA family transcriptional regulator [Noviherbaspirillum aridicola]|uniref:Conjugal transfer protein TraR n=1 Tax=Noviherbaspirillum aridicola TaxID=2849687 RepID=A0ABQ4QA67_9BURK|nr:TraR/DksA family transcriptional regulator [Noviherbaspirillum aridicola]GIZ53957.1 conjugal transfer protein TraR [Noviherbaspirillum aridicola]